MIVPARRNIAAFIGLAALGGGSHAFCRSQSTRDGAMRPVASKIRRKRVLFMRHGESLSNASGTDAFVDPDLTEVGEEQARRWGEVAPHWDVGLVLVSPLHRAMRTAAFAFGQCGELNAKLVPEAREQWWWYSQCRGEEPKERTLKKLRDLPNGFGRVLDSRAFEEHPAPGWHPEEERRLAEAGDRLELQMRSLSSLRGLAKMICESEEDTIAVVSHWGVLNAFFGLDAGNAEVVVSIWQQQQQPENAVEEEEEEEEKGAGRGGLKRYQGGGNAGSGCDDGIVVYGVEKDKWNVAGIDVQKTLRAEAKRHGFQFRALPLHVEGRGEEKEVWLAAPGSRFQFVEEE